MRLAQRPARDDADLVAGQLARGAQVHARVRHRPAGEEQAAALDLELAAVGVVLAFLHLEFPGPDRALVRLHARADGARDRRGEPESLHRDLVPEREAHVARDFETLAVVAGRLRPHDALVGGHEHGARRVCRPDARLGNRDFARDVDAAIVQLEPEVGRGEDTRFRHVRDQEPVALERELAVQPAVAPAEAAIDLERPIAGLARGIEREGRVLQAQRRAQLPQAQVRLVEVERAVGDARFAREHRRSDATGDREIEISLARCVVDGIDQHRQQVELARAAPHAAADRQVRERGIGQALCLERHGEVECRGVGDAQVQPVTSGVGVEREARPAECDRAVGSARGLIGERRVADLGLEVRDPRVRRRGRKPSHRWKGARDNRARRDAWDRVPRAGTHRCSPATDHSPPAIQRPSKQKRRVS